MSYITHSLGRNETLRYRAHFHWFYYFGAWGAFLISLAAAAVAYAQELPWAAGIAVLMGVAAFLSIMIPIWTTKPRILDGRCAQIGCGAHHGCWKTRRCCGALLGDE